LNLREYAILLPLVFMAFWIGIYPKPFFNYINSPVDKIVHQVNPDYYKSPNQLAVSPQPLPATQPAASLAAPATLEVK